MSSMGDPALSGSLFRRLQRCETRRRSVDKVEAFQMYMLYCTAHTGARDHIHLLIFQQLNLFILITWNPPVLAKKRYIFLILVLCLCGDLYQFQQFSMYRALKLQAW